MMGYLWINGTFLNIDLKFEMIAYLWINIDLKFKMMGYLWINGTF
jgi:hypothetical protein